MEGVAVISDFQGKGYDFALRVYDYLKSKESGTFPVKLINIEKTQFKDGEFKLKIEDNIRRKKCFYIHDSNKPPCEWLTELAFGLEAMTFSSPDEINLILPYTRFARQDRKEASRVSVNARVVADIVSLYATRGITVDLHTAQMQEYFSIPFDNLYSFPVLIGHLNKNHPNILENLVIVSPDLGGGKRAEALLKRLNSKGLSAEVAMCHKTRERDNEVAKTTVIGDVQDKNCLVVDDIIDTGNTLLKTCEALKDKGAKGVFAYGTHALMTDGTDKFSDFDRVFVSDTLHIEPGKNIEVVSMSELFGEAIYRTVIGKSLSSLFDQESLG
jgi:ribose-phosphate pyrophosphokinase